MSKVFWHLNISICLCLIPLITHAENHSSEGRFHLTSTAHTPYFKKAKRVKIRRVKIDEGSHGKENEVVAFAVLTFGDRSKAYCTYLMRYPAESDDGGRFKIEPDRERCKTRTFSW
ncbi:hypothetical protein RBA41_31290 [Massilia sp. CCM 9210]|uniref:hypothetical protein n=1 Tax=Massilia scottii TaxID=3057166 RepID=UPI002796729D|nr:hypothetical protein [Massilia sp. CCM 9210]MDQ1817795.1 hypothetical protein [Massilia sp. CCM 9210]